MKSAYPAILPPSTEDYCFVRAVPLADEAFFHYVSDFAIARDALPRPAFDKPPMQSIHVKNTRL
ncbi:hypothetical protein XH89_10255 [Bradyrhizobium sp. CCBAU 53340]|nr:hypothetical protein XH89_10255 [Bradyrhizobium sp. CCBAU 53340]